MGVDNSIKQTLFGQSYEFTVSPPGPLADPPEFVGIFRIFYFWHNHEIFNSPPPTTVNSELI